MRSPWLLMTLLLAACGDAERAWTFNVRDDRGALVTDAETECVVVLAYRLNGIPILERTPGAALGDGSYQCTMPGDAPGILRITAREGESRTSIADYPIIEDAALELVLWRPAIMSQRDELQVDVSWDRQPPASTASAFGEQTFIAARARIPIAAGVDHVIVPFEVLEDFIEPAMTIQAYRAIDPGLTATYEVEVAPVAHPAIVPVSRGAGCRGFDGATGELEFAPGTCPVTDGEVTWMSCGGTSLCYDWDITVDLGLERLVDRIVVRTGHGGNPIEPIVIETSIDGNVFEDAPNIDALAEPRQVRYVRASAWGSPIAEITAFAPR